MHKGFTIVIVGLILYTVSSFTFSGSSISSPTWNSDNSASNVLFPLPKKLDLKVDGQPLIISPCQINYKIIASTSTNIQAILNHYLTNVFLCKEIKPKNITFFISVKDPNQTVSQQKEHERYLLNILNYTEWNLFAETHVGFLRGFETFSQLFEVNPTNSRQQIIRGIPISIIDEPDYVWRGVMLDTSRHFYPVSSIKHLLDGILYNKMSIFHWHIIDQDSFPMDVQTRPELSEAGSVGGRYSKSDILQIIAYAQLRGIRVIPQFDTPAHTQSWGRSQALKEIVVNCDSRYQGQFDPTIDLTYEVVKDVMKYIDGTFKDRYAHFGGDQIEEDCWDMKPSIKQWMLENNIGTYKQLEIYYRQKQKRIWRDQISNKKAIYWANEEINLPTQNDDVIQWWGDADNVSQLENRTNQIILSNYDITYLDLGFGGDDGLGYGTYITWRKFYEFNPRLPNVNVIGGQACMWGETANEDTLDQKVWIRSSALAQRLWNTDIQLSINLENISRRLTAHANRMKQRGFDVSAVTVGLCEKDPSICFGQK